MNVLAFLVEWTGFVTPASAYVRPADPCLLLEPALDLTFFSVEFFERISLLPAAYVLSFVFKLDLVVLEVDTGIPLAASPDALAAFLIEELLPLARTPV